MNLSPTIAKLGPAIAKLGENPAFVAFNAHCFFAFFVVHMATHVHVNVWVASALALLVAGWKEFYFDAREEKDPPQTFMDNLTDFMGYACGVGMAGLVTYL